MKYLIIVIALVAIGIAVFVTVNKVSPVGWGWWGTTNTRDGVALGGYDPVSYFEAGQPGEGSDEHSYEWADAIWHFQSAASRDTFAANPARYAPQFGGFCAFAVSKGFTANPSPQAWYIGEDKLYLFADQKVRKQWVETIDDGSLEQSNANWAKR